MACKQIQYSDATVLMCGEFCALCSVAPEVMQFEGDVRLLNESEATLTCSTRGRPLPTVTFYKDDVPVVPANSNKYSVIGVTANSSDEYASDWLLTIHAPFDSTESGVYRCEAVNRYGTGRQSAMFTIIDNTGELSMLSCPQMP